MGRKRKQFIDKKTAHRFTLMHRSQQDPVYHMEDGSKMVLHPADQKTATALKKLGMGNLIAGEGPLPGGSLSGDEGASEGAGRELREVDELGLPVDGYDYNKHLAPIDGGGMFVSKSGEVKSSKDVVFTANGAKEAASSKEASSKEFSLPDGVLASDREYDRMLDAITLRPERMDRELRVLLEEDDDTASAVGEEFDGCVNTLEDDFMTQLMAAEAEGGDDDGFDFDEHVKRLMAEAELEDAENEEFDSEEEFDFEDVLHTVSSTRPKREIDEHFERVLAEYDDDEIGELEPAIHDERVGGVLDENAEHMKILVGEFLAAKKEDEDRPKEIGATAANREARTFAAGGAAGKAEAAPSEEAGQDGDDGAADAEEEDDFDEDEMLSRFGYENRPKPKWDCETIVSTYSTLDNHPTLLVAEGGRRRKKKGRGRLKDGDDDESDGDRSLEDGMTMMSINTGIARDRKETSEEKKLRKRMVKEQHRMRRLEKKSTKELFKEETMKNRKHALALKAAAAPPEGVSTFRF